MKTSRPVLRTRNLSHSYANANGGVPALRDLNLAIPRNAFMCVVGPSGCGKTTLLRLLSGLLQPSSGEILFEGARLERPRRRIGFVFQEANLMPWRTTWQNVSLPLELRGDAKASIDRRVQDMVELVGLEGFEEARPKDLSGGMAQRVALGRALVHEPELLLLDEPFGSLDALSRQRMEAELMRVWHERPVTVLLVTHSIEEAVLMADRVIVLSPRPGRTVLDLPVDLPRPRDLKMTYSQAFGDLAARVRAAIGHV